MHTPDATTPTWFAGDLDDPWVAGIADALPRATRRLDCGGDLPEDWPEGPSPATLVLHRANLTRTDAERLRALRERGPRPPRVVLCAGPLARYHQWERWGPLVEAVLPESTASETVARHVAAAAGQRRCAGPRPRMAVVGGDFELRRTLAEICAGAGYPSQFARSWDDAPAGLLTLAAVPVLEDGWDHDLARAARSRPVVALLGFADRQSVALARRRGAVACLDLPCDLADLVFVLDRLAAGRAEPPHAVPPSPAGLLRSRPIVADARRPA